MLNCERLLNFQLGLEFLKLINPSIFFLKMVHDIVHLSYNGEIDITFNPCFKYHKNLHVRTNRAEQTVQTLIRLLQKEQSDQGIHCLPFHLHLLVV